MRRLLFLFALFYLPHSLLFASGEITPSHVYTEVVRIQRELDLIQQYKKNSGKISVTPIQASLKPIHTWQKTYEILVKINILREEKLHIPVIAINSLQPVEEIDSSLVFEQTQRILTELRLAKRRMNIQTPITSVPTFQQKSPANVFNLLNQISYQLDIINGEGFTPSYVFAQGMRIYDDVQSILEMMHIEDISAPKPKNRQAVPADVFAVGEKILSELMRIQLLINLSPTDFSAVKVEKATPSDVFNLTGLILAEIQPIKATLGLKHVYTPSAKHYVQKIPGDVLQIMDWCLQKLKLIQQQQIRRFALKKKS